MKKSTLLFLIFVALSCRAQQAANPYGLTVISNQKDYLAACKKDPDMALVDIKAAIPSIVLDIRYATTNNFMQKVMYKQARAFARRPVVERLRKIQATLNKQGYGLKIYDAYRPYSVTVDFYNGASDKNFVANPNKGSRHNRGCAIDLTLIDMRTKKELPMPTPYDSFAPEAAARFEALPAQLIRNRDLLIQAMEAQGFRVLANEWWHFDLQEWEKYPLMDIPFEKL